MLLYVVLCLSILISVHGQLNDRGREHIIKRYGKCLDEFNMTPESFTKPRDGDLDTCFMACYFKYIKMMNDKGMLELEPANETPESTNDDMTIRLVKAFPVLCKEVNENDVSDGDKGCERAKMLADCLTEVGGKLRTARIMNRY